MHESDENLYSMNIRRKDLCRGIIPGMPDGSGGYFECIRDKEYVFMPMDGLTAGFAARELNQKLAGGRIDKTSQPEKDTVILLIRLFRVY